MKPTKIKINNLIFQDLNTQYNDFQVAICSYYDLPYIQNNTSSIANKLVKKPSGNNGNGAKEGEELEL